MLEALHGVQFRFVGSLALTVGMAGICNQMPSRKLWALVRTTYQALEVD